MEDKKNATIFNGSLEKEHSENSTFSIKTSELPLGIMDDSENNLHDGNLSRAKLLWYLGDWEALSNIEAPESTVPQYALICLMKASALQQTGDTQGTLKFATLAKQNGVDDQLLKQILVGGLHHSIGRIHAIKGNYDKAREKIGQAISLVDRVEDPQSGILSRVAREVSIYGSNDLAIGVIKQSLPKKINTLRPTELKKRLDELNLAISSLKCQTSESAVAAIPKQLITPGDVLNHRAERVVILIASMRHSGSTVLFNIIRIASELSGLSVKGGYSEKLTSIRELASSCQVLLIKTHEFRDDIAEVGDYVFTTIRDLRDTVASAKRRNFPIMERMGGVVEYAKYNRSIHDVWSEKSDFVFDYEVFMKKPFQIIQKILAALDLDINLVDSIYEKISSLPVDNYELTLLSDTHITDPKRNLTYANSLKSSAISKIEEQHRTWLEKYGYIELSE